MWFLKLVVLFVLMLTLWCKFEMQDPSKFVVAAAAVSADAGGGSAQAGAAAKVEEKKEESDEEDYEGGFGLFDEE